MGDVSSQCESFAAGSLVSFSGEDSCFVDSQEGPSTTGPQSALIVVQWSNAPPGCQQVSHV